MCSHCSKAPPRITIKNFSSLANVWCHNSSSHRGWMFSWPMTHKVQLTLYAFLLRIDSNIIYYNPSTHCEYCLLWAHNHHCHSHGFETCSLCSKVSHLITTKNSSLGDVGCHNYVVIWLLEIVPIALRIVVAIVELRTC